MKHLISCLLFIFVSASAQKNPDLARTKAREAIKLMDSGEIEKSIVLLRECENLDPEDYTYPYEIGYAFFLKKDYQAAIDQFNTVKKYKNANSQVYQMSGNCYSYAGKPDQAIREYEEGLKRFPEAGNLHLEKGNIWLYQEKYNEAATSYKAGIDAQPMFASNYFRLSKLYLSSSDKLSGLIYGELFMNLERTTERTKEMSVMLLDAYKSSIKFYGDSTKIDFCEVIIDAADMDKNGKFRMPLCGVFGKHFVMATLGKDKVNLESLSSMRTSFLKDFYKEDYKEYPNPLFAYHKKLFDENLFEPYNYYIFQIGAPDEFAQWRDRNPTAYDRFRKWYTDPKNELAITKKNKF